MKGVPEISVRPDMDLIRDQSGEVHPVLRAGIGRNDLETALRMLETYLTTVDLGHLREHWISLDHALGDIEDDRCLISVAGRGDDFGRLFAVAIQEIEPKPGRDRRLPILPGDLEPDPPVSSEPLLIDPAEHRRQEVALPREKGESLAGLEPLLMGEKLFEEANRSVRFVLVKDESVRVSERVIAGEIFRR